MDAPLLDITKLGNLAWCQLARAGKNLGFLKQIV